MREVYRASTFEGCLDGCMGKLTCCIVSADDVDVMV